MTKEIKVKGTHGGARASSGRKPSGDRLKPVVIAATWEQHALFQEIGGPVWLRGVIDEELKIEQASTPTLDESIDS
jgi:hypothetical protein